MDDDTVEGSGAEDTLIPLTTTLGGRNDSDAGGDCTPVKDDDKNEWLDKVTLLNIFEAVNIKKHRKITKKNTRRNKRFVHKLSQNRSTPLFMISFFFDGVAVACLPASILEDDDKRERTSWNRNTRKRGTGLRLSVSEKNRLAPSPFASSSSGIIIGKTISTGNF